MSYKCITLKYLIHGKMALDSDNIGMALDENYETSDTEVYHSDNDPEFRLGT